MAKKRSVFLILILIFSSVAVFDEAYAHSMFNSAEQFEAGYRVQVATSPEFPQIGKPSQFLVKVTEGFDYKEVDRFTIGIRIFFNGQQVDTIPPKSIEGSHWDFDYVWRQQGNHIVKIDLYDVGGEEGIVTYTFNMGTQSPFGVIFFSAIIVGALVFTGTMIYIYLPKIFKKSKL
ncbi:hypothetical protein [Nitrosopumilus ureiphilus]|uniref:Copper-binding protein n=1 Tax=Nitrosopumilus ureiphilus TaxID=1470067 RepID=A0A7D5RFN6_9ARCH|nr:hypothetical protein [Nitrosopumilus ureiphilus]QLH05825.1 hypothetical protein C5F50_01055 [Nitrosopumilus ureiphilus]